MSDAGSVRWSEGCVAEIHELHQFFQDWFSGSLAADDSSFDRFANALAEDFSIVSPEGTRRDRAELLPGLRSAHGTDPGTRIWIENAQLRWQRGAVALATYEEWQERGGQTTARRSSAVFEPAAEAPGGVRWIHVHEVWLPGHGPADSTGD